MKAAPAVTIVPFSPAFRDAFFALNKVWLDRHFLLEPYDIEVLSNPEKMVLAPGGEVFFGVRGGAAVATFALTPRAEGVVELNKMAVDEGLRAQGIGHKLMSFLIAHCRKRGVHTIELYSHTKLESALHLYRKFEFKEVALPEDCVYDRADIRMQLVL